MAEYRYTLEGCLDLYEPGDKIARYIWGVWHVFTIKKLKASAGEWHYYDLEDRYTIENGKELPSNIYKPLSGTIYFYRSEPLIKSDYSHFGDSLRFYC